MLRHAREQTYIENRKHKEHDRNHKSRRINWWIHKFLNSGKRRKELSLEEHLRDWDL